MRPGGNELLELIQSHFAIEEIPAINYEKMRAFLMDADYLPNLDDSTIWKSMGNIFFNQKDYQSALTCYQFAVEIDKYNTDALNNIGMTYKILGKEEEAKRIFESIKEIELEKQTNPVLIRNSQTILSKYPVEPLPEYSRFKKGPFPTIKEYRRTCNKCGAVWYSLKSRESILKVGVVGGAFGSLGGATKSCGTCGMCGGTEQATYNRQRDANQAELDRLKSCPQCGSINYYEEVLEYKR